MSLKEEFEEVIEDMNIHTLYSDEIFAWIEQKIKEARISELQLIRQKLNPYQMPYENGDFRAKRDGTIKMEIENRIKELEKGLEQ